MRGHFNAFILPLDVICDMLKFEDACEMASQHYGGFGATKVILSDFAARLNKHRLNGIYEN